MSAPGLWLLALGLAALALGALGMARRQLRRQRTLVWLLLEDAAAMRRLVPQPRPNPSLLPQAGPEAEAAYTQDSQVPAGSESDRESNRESGPASLSAVLTPWEPEFAPARAVPAMEELSELDRAVLEVRQPLGRRLERLRQWEEAATVRLAGLSPLPGQMAHLHRELREARTLTQVVAAGQELEAAWQELLAVLAGSMERDLDPLRANQPLQQAMAGLLDELRVHWIAPAPGEPFHPRRHQSLGVFRPGSAAESGLVGEVLSRGLEDSQGRVLLRAEVREFG